MKAKLDFGAEIDILSGEEFNKGLRQAIAFMRAEAESLKHVRLPVLSGQVAAGGTITLGSEGLLDQSANQGALCGPRSGFAWRITRVSVTGLLAAEELSLYWADASPQRYVAGITGPGLFNLSTKSLLLKPTEHLVVSGSGLTAGETITVSGEAIEVVAEQIFKIL